jgi:hypothetical protein
LPSSQYHQISKIMDLVITLKPNSILDIGAGFGKYGVLCREYLELWDGRQKYAEFLRRIDCIEAYKNYITPLHQFIYIHVYIEDILKLIDKLDFNYDLVLLIDVLEHFNKAEGELLLNKILSKNNGILISTPKKVSNQKDAFDNAYETHRSQWRKEELLKLENSFFIQDGTSFIGYIGKKEDVKKLKREQLSRAIKKIPAICLLFELANVLLGNIKNLSWA